MSLVQHPVGAAGVQRGLWAAPSRRGAWRVAKVDRGSAAGLLGGGGGSRLGGRLLGGGLRSMWLVARKGGRSAVRLRSCTKMCGIIGIFKHYGNVNVELYEGLLMLQHRGQDSAGMVTTDWGKFKEHKGNGLVKDVFESKKIIKKLKGSCGIGHVRYPTAGASTDQEAQPFFVNSPFGISLIHNGNLTNTKELGRMLQSSNSFFHRHLRTDSDSELLLNVFADEIHRAHQTRVQGGLNGAAMTECDLIFDAGASLMKIVHGAYACISLVMGIGMVAFRDPYGIRPLVLGHRSSALGDEWCVASEDCAFGPIGFTRVRDLRPGEMFIIKPDGSFESRQCAAGKLCPCIFEYIYLSRPDSVLNDIPVYNYQLALGKRLADRIKATGWDIDVVVPVPDGSRPAAIQVSAELGLPYREGLVKNRYVGRTFIMPDQQQREVSVRRKLNAMPAVFKDKKVLLIDDSIVRGTTMSQIVEMVRSAGAAKVYLASASPPVKFPNVYGVDMPSRMEFVANGLSVPEVQQVLGADGLIYQEVEDLVEAGQALNPTIEEFDASCFTGRYVTGNIDEQYLKELETTGRGAKRTRHGSERATEAPAAAR